MTHVPYPRVDADAKARADSFKRNVTSGPRQGFGKALGGDWQKVRRTLWPERLIMTWLRMRLYLSSLGSTPAGLFLSTPPLIPV